MRYISDDEKIRSSILYHIEQDRNFAKRWHSVEEFLIANPDCCHMGATSYDLFDVVGRLFGYHIEYSYITVQDNFSTSGVRTGYFALTNCAEHTEE
jgi:hypothetical protein